MDQGQDQELVASTDSAVSPPHQPGPEDLPATQPAGKPERFTAEEKTVIDWMLANGVDEWLPWQPSFHVEGGPTPTLTYTAHMWTGSRGWDPEHIARANSNLNGGGQEMPTELRTVPLLVAPDDAVRAACRAQNLLLSGDGGNRLLNEPDRRENVRGRLLSVVSSFGGQTIVAGEQMEQMVARLADEAEALARDGYLPPAARIPYGAPVSWS